MSRSRRLLTLAGKLAIAALLVGWLLRSGTLDFGALRLFLDRPELLAANLAVFSIGVTLGALRWRLLLRLADVRLSVGRAVQLQFAAMFFNVVIPGNIGGDVFKSVYVARTAKPEMRPTVYLIALIDRLIALAGLVVVAVVLILLRGSAAWETGPLRELAGAVVALAAITLVAPIVLFAIIRSSGERWTHVRIIGRLIAALRLVAARPSRLVAALGLAIVVQATGMALFAALATATATQDISAPLVASLYPLGMLTVVIPISYAGIGVGHVAFEQLFALVGLSGGATAFNLYLIGQTAPCLAGVLPFLTLRRAAPPPTEAEIAAQTAYDVPP